MKWIQIKKKYMSVNNFENKVQQKMDELRLLPSQQVWEQVERRIHEKTRRRVLVFWILLAGLLLTGGVIVYRQVNNDLPGRAVVSNSARNRENNSPEKNNFKEDNSLTTATQPEKQNAATVDKINAPENPEEKKVIIADDIDKNKTVVVVRRKKESAKNIKKNEAGVEKTEKEPAVVETTPAEQTGKSNSNLIVDKSIPEPAKEKPAEGISVISGNKDGRRKET
jgi:hypothetical protein